VGFGGPLDERDYDSSQKNFEYAIAIRYGRELPTIRKTEVGDAVNRRVSVVNHCAVGDDLVDIAGFVGAFEVLYFHGYPRRR
jgi:hypothetical protein